jgi:AraC family transcriptional regulator
MQANCRTKFRSISAGATNSRAGNASRIVALQAGGVQPLVNEAPTGVPSPSQSLVIERFELDRPADQSFVHVNDVVTLFLKPATLRHQRGNRAPADVHIDRGEAVICVRNDRESLVWKTSLNALCVQICASVLSEAAGSILNRNRATLQPTLGTADPRLTNLLWVLEAEQASGYPAGRLLLDSIETALAMVLVTSHNATPCQPVVSQGGLAPRRLRRVLDFMDHSMPRQVGLAELAGAGGLSPTHFSHQFRASVGMSPYKYLRTLRIQRSQSLLKNRDLSVLEVATAVGFDNQQHFATVFRSVVGARPQATAVCFSSFENMFPL